MLESHQARRMTEIRPSVRPSLERGLDVLHLAVAGEPGEIGERIASHRDARQALQLALLQPLPAVG